MDAPRSLRPDSLLIHADRDLRPAAGSVAPPIVPSSTFAASTAEAFTASATTPLEQEFYTRYGNPNQAEAAAMIAALEGAERALVFASGMSAISTTALALIAAGDEVVLQRNVYGGTAALADDLLARLGFTTIAVPQDDSAAIAAAIGPKTALVLLETPSNPRLGITDIAAVSKVAHAHGALVAVDSTFATPILQQPLEHGADLVLHSATKYLGGHGDLLAGAVAGSHELIQRIWKTSLIVGGTLSPFDAWLLLRGMRTLGMRVRQQSATTQRLAEFLAAHPRVQRVHYPGLPDHPGHDVAVRQMTGGFGGVLSFELADGGAAAEAMLDRLRLPRRAPSLGGVESLIVRPAAMWATQLDEAAIAAIGIGPGLVRLAVGIEDPDDLLEDLDQALRVS